MRADHRAALLAVLIAAEAVVAVPVTRPVTPEALASERGRAAIAAWSVALAPAGISRERLERGVIDGSAVLAAARAPVAALVEPAHRLLGVGQGWDLFASVSPWGHELVVWGETPQGRRLLTRKFDPDARFLVGPLMWRRTRGVWDGTGRFATVELDHLAHWVADAAFASWPDLTAVELELVAHPVPAPDGGPAAGESQVRHRRRVARGAP